MTQPRRISPANVQKVLLMDTSGEPYNAATTGGSDATAANQVLQITQETATNTILGVVAASPAANTIGDRLKSLLSLIVLAAGSNIIGKVGIDQTTDGTTNRVNNVEAGDSYNHITTSTTTVVKNTAGTIKKVSVNSLGTVASTVSIQDSATVLAVINSLTLSGTWTYNIACATNITIVTTGTLAPDVTVTYR